MRLLAYIVDFPGSLCYSKNKQHATIQMKHTEAHICMRVVSRWYITAHVLAQPLSFWDISYFLGLASCSLADFSHRVTRRFFGPLSGDRGPFWVDTWFL